MPYSVLNFLQNQEVYIDRKYKRYSIKITSIAGSFATSQENLSTQVFKKSLHAFLWVKFKMKKRLFEAEPIDEAIAD